MPTYVYRRPDGTTFEVFQRISDAPLTEDPETGAPVSRVISGGAGLQFKGDGFYLTDYVKKAEPASKEKGSESATTSGGAGKTHTKEAPTPTKAATSGDD